jgi:polyvinyl alcohol dehydrogenase (cytochrome)
MQVMSLSLLFLLVGINLALAADWPMSNRDAGNSRHQPGETTISPANVSRLAPVFTLTTDGDVWATPVVTGDAIYASDAGGKLWKFDRASGKVIWSHAVAEYNGVASSAVRTSVVVAEGLVMFGDRSGANMIAVDALTGERRWITRIDEHPAAQVTGSPIVVGERLYVGVSANEGLKFLKDRNTKSTFRGSLVALDIKTGKMQWKTWTMPDNGGRPDSWSGGAVISVPGVNEQKGLLYFGTDHQYTQPESVSACLKAAPDDWSPSCYPADARFNSVTAVDLSTGAPRWTFFGSGVQVWEMACGELPRVTYPFPLHAIGTSSAVRICPPPSDYLNWAFAAGSPQIYSAVINGRTREVVGMAQKSGVYWAFDAETGEVLWHTLIGPWSEPGGLTWGAAYDGQRLYLALTNLEHVPHVLTSGTAMTGGFWTALDPTTGKILWQTADPQNGAVYAAPVVANGVVYVGSMATSGDQMYALDAATGAILWRFAAGGSVGAHPAVVDGRVYWGSGFGMFGGVHHNRLYVFGLDGK